MAAARLGAKDGARGGQQDQGWNRPRDSVERPRDEGLAVLGRPVPEPEAGTLRVPPSEHYGLAGDDANPHALVLDPAKAMGSWETARKNARKKANVKVRFHDLRHTAVSRMLEGGVPLAVVASLLGWCPSTTTKMAQQYGHIGNTAHRDAVAVLEVKEKPAKPKKRSRKKRVGKEKSKSRRPAEISPNVH